MEKHSGKKHRGIRVVLIAILAAGALFFGLFYVTDVEVIGNTRYNEAQIRSMALSSPLSINSILMSSLRSEVRPDAAFIERINVEYRSRNKLRLTVHEKYPIGYIETEEGNYYFDKDGVVLEVLDPEHAEEARALEQAAAADQEAEDGSVRPALTDVPKIVGLAPEKLVLGSRIEGVDEKIFATVLSLTKLVDKFAIPPDYVEFDKSAHMTLWYGGVRVALGEDTLLEEKVSRAAAILPELGGMTGVLHLEEYTGETQNIIFSEND